MNTNPFEFAPPLRSSDGRWTALASCVAGLGLVTSSMFSKWLVGDWPLHYYRVDWNAGAGFAVTCWFFSALLIPGLTLAMVAGRRRSYLPVAASFALIAVSVVGAIGVLFVLRQASHLTMMSRDIDVFERTDIPIHVSQAAWNGLAGFVVAAIASGRLWRLARRQAQQSRTALALVNAQLAVIAGDVVVEDDDKLLELVPTV